jgi:hypothetical protein
VQAGVSRVGFNFNVVLIIISIIIFTIVITGSKSAEALTSWCRIFRLAFLSILCSDDELEAAMFLRIWDKAVGRLVIGKKRKAVLCHHDKTWCVRTPKMFPIDRITLAFLGAHVCNLAINMSHFHLRLDFEIVGETSDFPQNSETETRMDTPRMPLIGWLRYAWCFQFPISKTEKVFWTALRSVLHVLNIFCFLLSSGKKCILLFRSPTNVKLYDSFKE